MQQLLLTRVTAERQEIMEWIARSACIKIELETPQDCVDILLTLTAGQAELYQYFPFLVQIWADSPQAEMGEVRRPFEAVELVLEGVQPGRFVALNFESELSGVPAKVGINQDQRDLAMALTAVTTRPCVRDARESERRQPNNTARLAREVVDSGSPVFIIGPGRSGSKILSWALGQHPNIGVLEDTNWLPLTLYGAASGFDMARMPERSAPEIYRLEEDLYLQSIGAAIDRLHRSLLQSYAITNFLARLSDRAEGYHSDFQIRRSRWNPKARWVDATPANTIATLTLARTFPKAQFIVTVRDPRQVIDSYSKFVDEGGTLNTARQAAVRWLQAMEVGTKARTALGDDRVMMAFYDDMAE